MPKAKKLPSGKWRVQAAITVDGKLIRKSFTADSPKKAEQMALNWQNDQTCYSSNNITLEQAFERYIDSKSSVLSPSTIRSYNHIKNNNFKDIMSVKIDSLTREQIQRSINLESVTHSPKTIRNYHGLLTAVLKMFRPSFTLYTSLPQKRPPNLFIPDDKEIKILLDAVKGTKIEIAVLLAAFGPLRRGEICALTNDDLKGNILSINKAMVYTVQKQWVVKQPKTTSSNRQIELPDFIVDKINENNGIIYSGTPDSLTRRFERVINDLPIPHFRFHDLRHYNVSILHALGIPDKYIQLRGGWRTNHTLNAVYNHALQDKNLEFTQKAISHFKDMYE